MDNINKHVQRLRQLAVAAKAAGDAEDYAMDAGNEGEAPARDPASLQRVEQVHMTSGEIERMTPQLITAAQVIKPFDKHLSYFSLQISVSSFEICITGHKTFFATCGVIAVFVCSLV